MSDLIKFEFHKLFRQKSFYICTAAIVAINLVTILISKIAGRYIEDPVSVNSVDVLLASVGTSFTLTGGIFTALFTCSDFGNQTIKNIYSRGFSRTGVYFAKLIACLAAMAIMFAVNLLANYLAALAFYGVGSTEQAGKVIALLLGQLLVCTAYVVFFFAVSIALRKTGAAIAFSVIGPLFISVILSLIDTLLKTKSFHINSIWLDGLLLDVSYLSVSGGRLAACLALPFAYVAAFTAAGYFINVKRDV